MLTKHSNNPRLHRTKQNNTTIFRCPNFPPFQTYMDACNQIQAPLSALSFENQQPNRRLSNFHPSVWGEYFLAYASNVKVSDSEEGKEHERLKEEVRKTLIKTPDKFCNNLELIDTVQRLGVSYHFESEIEASLLSMLEAYIDHDEEDVNDLHTVALRFRLLRQHGHYVSCDVFNKFKDQEGNFKESSVGNIQGLLSLYEAANYRVHDEDILEEALNFTTTRLESMLPNISNFLAAQVNQALDMPIQKTLNRVGARKFISLYKKDKSHDAVLLNFAKFDFNILQKMHQKELSGITKWWKNLDCPKNLPFARDRVVECYFWILGVYFEAKYSFARTLLTKVIALTSIIDDIYNAYGTFDELLLFTDSMQRMHVSGLDQLPPYMKHCYQALLDVYSEIEQRLAKEGKSNLMNYAISSMKGLVRAYLEEAKWYQSGRLPKYEEYIEVALVGCGYQMLATHSFVCMGEFVTECAVDWVSKKPLIVRASSLICRLMDDMVGREMEKERGQTISAGECFTEQYGASSEEAFAVFEKQVTNAWKDINKDWICAPTSVVPLFVLEQILNFSRVIYLLYREDDGYTNSCTKKVKDMIKSVLVDPVSI